MPPTRYVKLDPARARFGDRVDRLGAFFSVGDPLADAAVASLAPLPREARDALVDDALRKGISSRPDAPPALRALFAELDHVPFWVDFARCDRGGSAFLRTGVIGGFVLGFESIVLGYCSPAGNKPLVFSGRLEADVGRRLTETSRFVHIVSMPGGMRRHGEGFAAAVKVRLMHAQVRRMLRLSPRWNADAWGEPINQVDSAATLMLFSYVVLDGLRKLNAPLSPEDGADLLHLWRYTGYLMGVHHELLCANEAEAKELSELISTTQDPPDEDSVKLATAFMHQAVSAAKTPAERSRAQRFQRFAYALSRLLLGDETADALGYPRTPWRFAMPALRVFLRRAAALSRAIPGGDKRAVERGARYWELVVEQGKKGEPITFAMPDTLRYA